ncbi:MotA/TolQ/ExbB proton channel family protein [Isosphaeraceae bacterium EP7]
MSKVLARVGLGSMGAFGPCLALALCLMSVPSEAQEPPGAAAKAEPAAGRARAGMNAPAVDRTALLRHFSRSPMIWMLGICSVATMGFALERFVALRRSRVIPKDFTNRFLERLSGDKLDRDRAAELCRSNDSPVARVFASVVRHWGQPSAQIRHAVSLEASGEVVELKRNVRVLNGTTTLAPLLGLLGTVLGMIESFGALGGKSGAARGEALASGISLALVSTALGLAIAIVSVVSYYYLLNKVDVLVKALDDEAAKVIELVSAEAGVQARGPEGRRPLEMSRHDVRPY